MGIMEKRKTKKVNDLQSLIIRDIHGMNIFKRIVQSRIILTALLLLMQILLILLFILRLQQYIEYYFLVSIVLSVAFLIYLTNRQGKNEFKIAWFIPVMIFPLAGVIFYSLYLTDTGERKAKRALKRSKNQIATMSDIGDPETHLKTTYPDILDLQKYLIRERFLPYENNQIDYFPTGEAFFTDFIAALKNAQDFIFLETFILRIDETWDMILSVLEEKAAEGVEVRLMYDAFASPMASGRAYVNFLKSKEIHAVVFNPMIPVFTTRQNFRDHRKIYIIDGKVCYSGGLNFANEYFNYGENYFPYWKDNAIRIQGEAIRSFTTMFLENWNMQGSRKESDNYARFLDVAYNTYAYSGLTIPYGDDSYNDENIAENVYLYMTHSAKKYLHITSPYILLDNTFQEALLFAAHRGVDVRIIVPSVPDHFITFYIGKTFLKTLVENGIRVYLYKKGFIHAKTFITDDRTATVGSINLDYRSFYHHFECGTILHDVSAVVQIEADFQNTLSDCVEMKIGDYEKLPWPKRMIGRVFRVFSPLM